MRVGGRSYGTTPTTTSTTTTIARLTDGWSSLENSTATRSGWALVLLLLHTICAYYYYDCGYYYTYLVPTNNCFNFYYNENRRVEQPSKLLDDQKFWT